MFSRCPRICGPRCISPCSTDRARDTMRGEERQRGDNDNHTGERGGLEVSQPCVGKCSGGRFNRLFRRQSADDRPRRIDGRETPDDDGEAEHDVVPRHVGVQSGEGASIIVGRLRRRNAYRTSLEAVRPAVVHARQSPAGATDGISESAVGIRHAAFLAPATADDRPGRHPGIEFLAEIFRSSTNHQSGYEYRDDDVRNSMR